MKKSIVLLISLFFITAISALILKNLDDTDSYISAQNSKFTKTQILLLIDNVRSEVSQAILANNSVENSDTDYLSNYYNIDFPLKIEDINIVFKLTPYERENINLLKETEYEKYKDLEELFSDNSIPDFNIFMEIYNEKKEKYLDQMKTNNIESYKQIDDIINDFMKKTYSNKILIIKDKIGFFDFDQEKAKEDEKYDYYELIVKINYLKEFIIGRYIFNKEGKVENFELSFK